MTFLDNKGGNVKDGLGVGRGDGAVRTVKAKREADEAGNFSNTIRPASLDLSLDKEYRKGVHWLETLRLRRIKIMEGAFKVHGRPAPVPDMCYSLLYFRAWSYSSTSLRRE